MDPWILACEGPQKRDGISLAPDVPPRGDVYSEKLQVVHDDGHGQLVLGIALALDRAVLDGDLQTVGHGGALARLRWHRSGVSLMIATRYTRYTGYYTEKGRETYWYYTISHLVSDLKQAQPCGRRMSSTRYSPPTTKQGTSFP